VLGDRIDEVADPGLPPAGRPDVIEDLAEGALLADLATGEFEDAAAADEPAGAVGASVVDGPLGDSGIACDERRGVTTSRPRPQASIAANPRRTSSMPR